MSREDYGQTVSAPQAAPPKQVSSAPFVLAIIALVTGLLGIFPVSLALAIIALAMNRGQKKRGEQSTKQTPTFVMALIALILSILMALATVVLGGAVWLAVVEGNIDPDRVTTSTTSSKEAPATASSSSEKGASSESSSASASSSTSSSSSEAQPTGSYSTDEAPTLGDFTWYAGAGGIPSGATELKKFADVKGGWKAYQFGSGMERLSYVDISGKKGSAVLTVDWRNVVDSSTGKVSDDGTPDSVFEGDWDGDAGLNVLGAGRMALTKFWEKSGRQYATGSFVWPSGETDTVLLVRP